MVAALGDCDERDIGGHGGEALGDGDDAKILGEVSVLADRLYRTKQPLVVVSLEVGLAPLPTLPGDLREVRLLTSANQMLAANAGSVVLMVSGVPLRIR